MKKNYTALLFFFSMLLALQGFSQSQRMVFIEEATQASCPPCATLNPALQAKVNANPDKVIFLAYQVWWPGFDAMYLDNSVEVDERVGEYYGYGFAPQIAVQGSFVTGSGDPGSLGNLTQANIDAINAEVSEFDMTLNAVVIDGALSVTGSILANSGVTGDLKLRIALAEHEITKAQAPGGTNTETVYHHVFKKFIGGTDGIDLANSWVSGDSYTINETFDIFNLNIYNYDGLELVAFIQNDDNKFVHQAAKVDVVPVNITLNNNTRADGIVDLPAEVCIGSSSLEPTVKIQNVGIETLTSLDIVYNINGGTDQTYNWTGSLETFEKVEITLDDYGFDAGANNTINVELKNPNGVPDENDANNSATASLEGSSLEAGTQLVLVFNFDCWPQENSWVLKNSAGATVAQGGQSMGYAGLTTLTDTVTLEPNDCHEFIFSDSYGDGMNGSAWAPDCTKDGNITINDIDGNPVYYYDGSYWVVSESKVFNTSWVNAVNEVALQGQISLTPNPTSGILKVQLDQSITGETNIQVFSMNGKLVQSQKMENANELTLDLSDNNNGIYLVRIVNGEKAATQRVTVQK